METAKRRFIREMFLRHPRLAGRLIAALMLASVGAAGITSIEQSNASRLGLSTAEGTPESGMKRFDSKRSGFVLVYDPEEWKRVKASESDFVGGERDRITLTNGNSRISIIGSTDYEQDQMTECRDDYVDRFFANSEVGETTGIGPVVIPREEEDRSSVGYLYYEVVQGPFALQARYTECRWLGDGVTAIIIQTAPALDFAAEISAREALLEGLHGPGSDVEATPGE